MERYDPTIENTFQKTIPYKRQRFFMQIVDCAGMDEHTRLSRNASVGVHGYLLVYAATSRVSFEKVKAIDDVLGEMHGGCPALARVLVATHIDRAAQRQVAFAEGQAFADERGIPFVECSAARNVNVGEVFATLLREIEAESGATDDDAAWESSDGLLFDCGASTSAQHLHSWCDNLCVPPAFFAPCLPPHHRQRIAAPPSPGSSIDSGYQSGGSGGVGSMENSPKTPGARGPRQRGRWCATS